MEQSDSTEQFVRQLTENQNRLYGYVYSLVGDHSRASDVVQETNLVLWRKVAEFDSDKAFLPWAYAIARFQVLAHLRDKSRDRLLLDAELAEKLSPLAEHQGSQLDAARSALRPCMQLLTDSNRQIVEQRYLKAMSIADVAQSCDRSVSSIKVALMRIRRQLADCMQKRIAAEAGQ